MAEWYYRLNAESHADDHGPIASQELLKLIRDGVINEDTLIRKDDSNWVASVDINGLWAAAGRPSAAFQCPHCGKPIPKPPVNCSACNQRILHAVGRLVQPKKIVSRPTTLSKAPESPKPQTEGASPKYSRTSPSSETSSEGGENQKILVRIAKKKLAAVLFTPQFLGFY